MQKILQNKDAKITFIFTFIGIIASIFVGMYQITVFNEGMKQQIIAQLGSMEVLIIIAGVQGGIFTFLATFIGLKLARKVNLTLNFKFDKIALIQALLIAFATAFIIIGSDNFIFAQYLPEGTTNYKFSFIYFLSGILYGGIIEEILLRLLMMSFFVWVLWKVFAKSKDYLSIPNWIYIAAIFIAAILFAAGHLPFTSQTLGLSVPILIRAFVLNGIGGIGFGYLYWKKGLAYSMVAHASTHVFMQLLFMPLFYIF